MRILFLSHYFPPEVNAPASRTHEHCRRWVEAGHDVTVVTCAPNCPNGVVFDGYKNHWRREEVVDGIRVVRVWSYIAANQGFAKRILNFLSYMVMATWASLRCGPVDVVVATSPQFFCGWAGVFAKLVKRKPLVLEIRDIWPESILAVGAMKRSFAIRLLERLERWMYATSDHIVTVGDGYRSQLLDRGVSHDKITVTPNGVDLSVLPDGSACTIPLHAGQSPGDETPQAPFICSYIGTVGMAHGLDVMLEAAEQLSRAGRADIEFWIVGDGAERQRLEAAATERGLNNIIFHGMVKKSAVASYVASSNACLVHLRKTDLFSSVIPSKIFEIMAQQTPIIMGVGGGARDVVLEAQAGVSMQPEDSGSVLDAIETIQKQPAAYSNGRSYVATYYDRRQLADSMLQTIARVAGQEQITTPAAPERRAA